LKSIEILEILKYSRLLLDFIGYSLDFIGNIRILKVFSTFPMDFLESVIKSMKFLIH
jgi:hypothetical protein